MNREPHGIVVSVSPKDIELEDRVENSYIDYVQEKALRDLGYEYAKKYATLETMNVYLNTQTKELEHYTKEPPKDRARELVFYRREYRYELK